MESAAVTVLREGWGGGGGGGIDNPMKIYMNIHTGGGGGGGGGGTWRVCYSIIYGLAGDHIECITVIQ